MAGREPTPAELRAAAREMVDTGHPTLARLLAQEADERERAARLHRPDDRED
jgi:hypothetical protein